MYAQHFKLAGTPFSIAPDPRFLYLSAQHREALAHLLYGIGAGGGFVLLTGEIGAGKTTICRSLLQQVPPHCEIAYVFNPRLSPTELLQTVCEEFGVDIGNGGGRQKDLVDALNRHLLERHAQGASSVLIIDEAQNLSADVLEQLRLLTNLETSQHKLLQIILIGQPELRRLVEQPQLEQLAQRIIARYHLGPLSRDDTEAYISHRLAVAGARSTPLFTAAAMRLVHVLSGGVPRRINLLCDRAMLAAYANDKPSVDAAQVRTAAREVFGRNGRRARRSLPAAVAAAVAVAVVGGAALLAMQTTNGGWSSALAGWRNGVVETASGPGASDPASDETPVVAARHPDVTGNATPFAIASAPTATAGDTSDADAAVPGTAAAESVTGVEKADAGVVVGELEKAIDFGEALAAAASSDGAPLRQLAERWNVRLEATADTDVCTLARSQGLHCYQGRGGFAELRQLNRPALLRLRDDRQGDRFMILHGLSPAMAVVQHLGQVATVRLAALESRFTGEFATFWRMPSGFRSHLHVGARGADVDHVAQLLARLAGEQAPAAGAPLDRHYVQQVRQFQLTQGLVADGVVGPMTWMRLNAAAGVSEPRLMSERPTLLARQ